MVCQLRFFLKFAIFSALLRLSSTIPISNDNPTQIDVLTEIDIIPPSSNESVLPIADSTNLWLTSVVKPPHNPAESTITIIISNLADGETEVLIGTSILNKLEEGELVDLSEGQKWSVRQMDMFTLSLIGDEGHAPALKKVGRKLMSDISANKYLRCSCVKFSKPNFFLTNFYNASEMSIESCSDFCALSGKAMYKSEVHVRCNVLDNHSKFIQEAVDLSSGQFEESKIDADTVVCHAYPRPHECKVSWPIYLLPLIAGTIVFLQLFLILKKKRIYYFGVTRRTIVRIQKN